MRSSRADVEKILADMRHALLKRKLDVVCREKNMETLSSMGLLFSDVASTMYALTYNEYIKEPEVDRRYPKSDKLWVFKTKLDNQIIYIKFKILYQKDGSVKTLSFHIDED